ncbi:MAG: transketolase [Phycisphaerae bacterium]|nr:transketolase [Phycisphaerae bacterium]
MSSAVAVHKKAAELGKLSLRMTSVAGSGHPSSALSLAHIVVHLMYERMRYDPKNPWHAGADRLVLSEGHAVPVVYAAYADLGGAVGCCRDKARLLKIEDVDTLRDLPSPLDGHPNPAEGMPFFDAATGSLGQGLSVAAGLGLGARLDGTDRRVYCLIGDGESREGQIWEAVDFIADHKLTNVCAVFNANGQGQADYVSVQQSAETIAAKLRAFNWDVIEIDGHDPAAITQAFDHVGQTQKPLAIVAKTVKGWGVDQLLNGNWHGKPLPVADLEAAGKSLDKKVAEFGTGDGVLGTPKAPAQPKSPRQRPCPQEVKWPTFADAMKAGGLESALTKGKIATRRAYGAALKVAGDVLPQVVALDGDVSNSTFANVFAKAHPDRFFECKIAEQNMVSAGAGLSAAGFVPFVNSFAKFISRAYDQVEMANISRANLKIVGSHAGISLAADGPSQMALVDVAFFNAFASVRDSGQPLCWSFHPADAVTAYNCTRLMAQLKGMCYMRTHRPDVPLLYAPDAKFEPGGFSVLKQGQAAAIVSAGYMTHIALEAAATLAKQGAEVAVIDAYCLPFDAQRMAAAIRGCGGRALVVEDNYGGGLSAAVAECAAAAGDLRVEVRYCQRIPKSTRTPEEVLDYCGVSAAQIAAHAQKKLV